MSELPLSVGDRVVYPNQGVCLVTGVDTRDIAGQRLTFVNLKREEDGAVVMVPQSKISAIGIRKVADAREVDKILAFLRSDSDKANLDWKQRARSNVDKMATGGLLGLAEVVKGLQVLSELRPLPTKERELYDTARHLLVAEMAVALGVNEVSAEDAIDVILFPPGKERPRRTAEEFRKPADEGDELGFDDDLEILAEDEADAPVGAEPEEAEEKRSPPPAPKKSPPSKKAPVAPKEKKTAVAKPAPVRKTAAPKASAKKKAAPKAGGRAKPPAKAKKKPAAPVKKKKKK